jgi:hypothetical protein
MGILLKMTPQRSISSAAADVLIKVGMTGIITGSSFPPMTHSRHQLENKRGAAKIRRVD